MGLHLASQTSYYSRKQTDEMIKRLEETVNNSQAYMTSGSAGGNSSSQSDSYPVYSYHGMIYGYNWRTGKVEKYIGDISWAIGAPK